MKKLELDEMVVIEGGAAVHKDYLCNIGMAAAGICFEPAITAATGGVGAIPFALGWAAFSTWVCGGR